MGISKNTSLVFQLLGGVGVIIASYAAVYFYRSFLAKEKRNKPKPNKILLEDPQVKYSLPLVEKRIINHDTRFFRFGLPSKEHVLGLPIGQHINISARIGGDLVVRSYTPVSSDDDYGYMDLVIKVYFKNVHPKFPNGGLMTQYLESLKIGDTIDIRGPSGKIQYISPGTFSITKLRKEPPTIIKVKQINLIAGGVGITPILQLVRQIAKDRTDHTDVAILFANQTEKDILLKNELDIFNRPEVTQYKVWYTVDRAEEGWQYSTGFVDEEMIRRNLFPPSDTTITLMCGPPPMINFACIPNLEKLGHSKDSMFAY